MRRPRFGIWVPGCATGEEAYSIAILAAEQVAAAQSACRVQVFATDIDDDALEIARSGVYPESIALDVTPQRLKRFFTREDHRYTIVTSIRESVVFAVQNVISDPPFSKMDLVSCRNVLIYLEPSVQEHVMAVFHFALNPGGYLFLGNAESIGPDEEWFSPVSKRTRIFRRLGTAKRPALECPRPHAVPVDTDHVAAKAMPESTVATLAHHALLEHLAPAAVVVRQQGQIAHVFGAMDRYIHLPAGDATLDVLSLARDPLKPALRAAFHDAVRRSRETVLDTLHSKRGRNRTSLRITVRLLDRPRAAERLWLMIFEERPLPGRPLCDTCEGHDAGARTTSRHRASSHDEGAAPPDRIARELKPANEEVLSMNKERQSSREEVVTSKEELQS